MPDFIAPSRRFSRTTFQNEAAPDTSLPDFYTPPKSVKLGSAGMSSAGSGLDYAQPKPAATRPGAVDPPGMGESVAGVVLTGLQNSSVPATTDVKANVASVAGNTLAGAASGALFGAAAGGVGALGGAAIGGGVALVTSGLNAWLGNRQARAERDRANALQAEQRRIAAQDRADLERWRTTYHLDTIEAAKEDRRRYNMEFSRQQMQKTAETMQNILATSQSAKASWAKFGF